jgi:ABC-2 type transport system ATP-binding protein
MSDPAIFLRGLTKRFGDTKAVLGVAMTVEQGEIFGFLGANGAGKTTTIRMLCGLTRPSAGSAKILGLDVWKNRFKVRSHFGYVPQRFSLYPDLTVTENLRFFGGAYGVPREELCGRIGQLLKEFDLEEKKGARAGNLSGGFKQLLSIACALIHRPSILFLDEPTAGLDPQHRQYIWDLLYELSQEGTTIFVTTHYMDEAERCTDVGFIHGGKLLVKGSPQSLKEPLDGKLFEIEVDQVMEAMQFLRGVSGIIGVDLRSGMLRIRAEKPHELLQSWIDRWPYPDFQLLSHAWVEPDMEDVFKAYSQGLKVEEEAAGAR